MRSPGANSCTAPPSVDAILARIAARQHGLVTIAQLAAAGLGRAAVAKRVANGRLHRKYPAVYALGHARLSREGEWMAAVLACGEGAVLSHLSASSMWGFWRRRVVGVDVLVPRRHRSLPGVRIHRYRRLDRRDVTRRNGIPITSVARTLVDLSDVLTPHQLANAIHEAAFHERFSEPATRHAMHRANGRHNLATLTEALALHNSGSAGTRSGNEDWFLSLTAQAGLPLPLVNTKVEDIEVDFHWPDHHLCVEVDGGGHTRPRTKREDKARDRALQQAVHRVVRIAEHELTLQTMIARLVA
jgi:Transcriptional regulator, AbiEi antitoxin/Protein of unknown function (DUF559)